MAVAAWIRYVGGIDESGASIDVRDPLAAELRTRAAGEDAVGNILALRQIFPADLATNSDFITPVTEAFHRLRIQGAIGAAQ